jgi:16S rRNA (guanine527-N7)-methyltransferase
MALVSRRDEGQLILKHVADALFAASQCPTDRAVIDIGSGAGFPGLPIAIAHPGSGVCLLESRAKKISFLLEAIRAVGALNAFTYHGRLEGAGRDEAHRGRYSVAIARALARPETALHAARPFLIPGGRAMIMISAAQAEQPGAVSEIISYRLPDGTPRALLVRVSRATPHPS